MKDKIRERLFELQDMDYKEFQSKLIPTISPELIIGVRTPELRKYAKELSKQAKADIDINKGLHNFMEELPHKYYEENNIHGFLIEGIRNYDECIGELNKFLPFVDNWATCDMVNPKVVKKEPEKFIIQIRQWIDSDKTYTIRYGIGMLMRYYLDDLFKEEYLQWVCEKHSEEYYVNMMIAWFFATALSKQYTAVIPYLEENRMSVWIHNKTIQKAIESNRIPKDIKVSLRAMKRKL